MRRPLVLFSLLLASGAAQGDEAAVKTALARGIIGPRQSLLDLQDHVEPPIAKMPRLSTAKEWDAFATKLRRDVLDRVVLRGEAKKWRAAKLAVEYFPAGPGGGEGYKIRKLRYEAAPALWIPG